MLLRRVGDTLLAIGALVGVAAIVGYELDFIPSLPPAMLKLVIYKLVFVAGIGFLVAGAVVRRLGLRYPERSDDDARDNSRALASDRSIASLPEQGEAAQIRPAPGTAARVERDENH
jgi:hypothetical protein